MVYVNLAWQPASFFCFSTFLAALCLGGTVTELTYASNKPLCFVCAEKNKEAFFANGAAFVYHIIYFFHVGGMAAGGLGLALSLLASFYDTTTGTYILERCFALAMPVAWLSAFAVHVAVLAVRDGWSAYPERVPATIWVWWVVFASLAASMLVLVVVSAHGLLDNTYVKVPGSSV